MILGKNRVAALVTGLFLCGVGIQGDAAVYYEITDLGFSVHLAGSPVVNNSLQIAGNRVIDGQGQGVLWKNGVVTYLGTLPDEKGSAPWGINDHGQIAGSGGAWLWENGSMTDLGVLPGYSHGNAFGINNAGYVVGYCYGGGANDEAFVWDGSTLTGLDKVGTSGTVATAVNNHNQIVGYTSDGRAIIWENHVMTSLGAIQGRAAAFDINDSSVIVGTGDTLAHLHAMLWFDESVIDLGTLPRDTQTDARAINNAGQIVGKSARIGRDRATLWSDGRVFDLNDLVVADWSLVEATDINNNGNIVGVGINPEGTRTTFLLTPTDQEYLGPNVTPVPEPNTLAVWTVLGGLSLVAVCRRR